MDLVQKYDNEIRPALSEHLQDIFSSLSPNDKGSHYLCLCPSCGKREAFIYKNSDRLECNRKNKCGYSVSVIAHLSGGSFPNGKNYVDIIKTLCEITGVTFTDREYSPQEIKQLEVREQKQRLLADFQFVVSQALLDENLGRAAQNYLSSRGFSKDKFIKYDFGFYPSKEYVQEKLVERSHLPSDVSAAGLYRDDWNGRITYPIKNRGRIGDFWARDITSNAVRYLRMSKESGSDSSILFGLDSARDDIIIVEGYFDALMLDAHGIKNTAALGGIHLTDAHIAKLEQHKIKSITLLLDNDETGIERTPKIIEKLANKDIEIFVADHQLLGESKDPDKFVQDHGAAALGKLLHEKIHGFRWMAQYIANKNKNGEVWQDAELTTALEQAEKFEKKVHNGNRALAMDFFWDEFIKITNISQDVIDRCRQSIQEKKKQETKKKLIENKQNNIASALASGDFDIAEAEALELSNELKKLDVSNEQNFAFLLENNTEEELIEEFQRATPRIETGFMLGEKGLIPLAFPSGGLSFICGPTGHGKTTMLINCSLGALNRNPDMSVYFFSYEEEKKKIEAKFLNAYCGFSLNDGNNKGAIYHYFHAQGNKSLSQFQYFKYNEERFLKEKDNFFNQYANTGRLKIKQYDMSVEELVEAIRFIKRNDNNAGLIVIDYVQKLYLSRIKHNARHEAIKEICDLLEKCAIETGLPIVLGGQFNRKIENESLVSAIGEYNVAEGHDIARSAASMVGLWNRSHNPDNPTNEVFITVLKDRDIGRGHDTDLHFNGNTGKIENNAIRAAIRDRSDEISTKYPAQSIRQQTEKLF